MAEKTFYFRTGDYALTSVNIEQLTAAVKRYNEENKWQWSIQDVLGIRKDGKIGKRFGEIQAAMAMRDEPTCKALFEEMTKVEEKDPSTIISTPRVAGVTKVTVKTVEQLKEAFGTEEVVAEGTFEEAVEFPSEEAM